MAAKATGRSTQTNEMRRTAGNQFDQYDQIIDRVKNEMKFNDSRQMIPDSLYKFAEELGDTRSFAKALDDKKRLFRVQREIGPLAWQGRYDYDKTEQFDDGDQSALTGDRGRDAKTLWAIAMDWHPNINYLSPLTKCLLLGDYEGMMNLIGEKKGDELQRLLESRDTFFKVPALFHVVRGVAARHSGESLQGWKMRERRYTYGGCFMKLLELGANIHARDFLGDTLLFHCVRGWGKGCPETHIMAEILLQRGLDVNSVNRLGETALSIPIMNRDLDAIKLLLSYGIDTSIKDFGSKWSTQQMAMGDSKIQKLISEQSKLVAERKKQFRAKFKQEFVTVVAQRDRDERSARNSLSNRLKNLVLGVLENMGVPWKSTMGELTTDQGDSSTCTVHALAKAVRQSLAEQSLNIDLKNCLASFLEDSNVDETGGNFPDDFHGVKIMSVGEETLKWPGSVELLVKSVSSLKKFEDESFSTSKDTKLVLVYNDPEAGLHSVFISGVEKIANEACFRIVNSWGTPQPGDLTHVRVGQEGNKVYEVRARWSPDGCDTVCKVASYEIFCLLSLTLSQLTNFFKVCFAPESKVCSRCYAAHFCSKECQRKDREAHQHLCSRIREEFQEVRLEWPTSGGPMAIKNVVTGKIKVHTKATETSDKKKHHILKVQKQFDEEMNDLMGKPASFLDTALTVYSQHHEIYGYISPKSRLYSGLKKSIEDEGLMNYKIYIKSCERDGKLWINPSRILYPRTW